MLNTKSGDDTHNPVLQASICGTLSSRPTVFKLRPPTPIFKREWRRWIKKSILSVLGALSIKSVKDSTAFKFKIFYGFKVVSKSANEGISKSEYY